MPRIPGTSNAQSAFLRAFLKSPGGPPPAEWPLPAILRRWLRRPTFRAALQSVRDAARFQADFHLAAAGTAAAASLQSIATSSASADSIRQAHALLHLLRHAHMRQRFTEDAPLPHHVPTCDDLLDFLRDRPAASVDSVLYHWERHLKEHFPHARPSAA